ncbi:heterokaryon incompatibility protein domain-containing protein [Trichoderma velutinum]
MPYEALPYTWGEAKTFQYIEVNGQKLGITENLYFALKNFRYPHKDRMLWVDAICIGQTNMKERSRHGKSSFFWEVQHMNRSSSCAVCNLSINDATSIPIDPDPKIMSTRRRFGQFFSQK